MVLEWGSNSEGSTQRVPVSLRKHAHSRVMCFCYTQTREHFVYKHTNKNFICTSLLPGANYRSTHRKCEFDVKRNEIHPSSPSDTHTHTLSLSLSLSLTHTHTWGGGTSLLSAYLFASAPEIHFTVRFICWHVQFSSMRLTTSARRRTYMNASTCTLWPKEKENPIKKTRGVNR